MALNFLDLPHSRFRLCPPPQYPVCQLECTEQEVLLEYRFSSQVDRRFVPWTTLESTSIWHDRYVREIRRWVNHTIMVSLYYRLVHLSVVTRGYTVGEKLPREPLATYGRQKDNVSRSEVARFLTDPRHGHKGL